MAQLVCNNATLQCSFGLAPSTFMVLPKNRVNAVNLPAANTMDFVPMMNIMPFGNCTSLANPTVASATSAAQGVLTPMPCIPVVTGAWTPGSPTVNVGGVQALHGQCLANCAWGGVIQVTNPGQTTVNVP
jgi:hypothetical protein